MTIGDKIRNYRKMAGLTQKQLGDLSGTSETTIKQYEAGKRQPRVEQLQKIANTLQILPTDLLDGAHTKNIPYTYHLEEDLKRIGCRVAWDEDNAIIWLETPEGALEVNDAVLKEMEESTVSFLQFKVSELIKKHPKDFRPRKR